MAGWLHSHKRLFFNLVKSKLNAEPSSNSLAHNIKGFKSFKGWVEFNIRHLEKEHIWIFISVKSWIHPSDTKRPINRGLAIGPVKPIQDLRSSFGLCRNWSFSLHSRASIWPHQSDWLNRDRFILSAGHGSMFLYAWLHLAGYDLPIEQLKQFRVLNSKTPEHHFRNTWSWSYDRTARTGYRKCGWLCLIRQKISQPLQYGRPHAFDYHVIALMGDGCFQKELLVRHFRLLGITNWII